MNPIQPLSAYDLFVAAGLVILLAFLSRKTSPLLWRDLLVAAARLVVQLLLIAWILEYIFSTTSLLLIMSLGLVMVMLAGREVRNRLSAGGMIHNSFQIATFSMFISSYVLCVFCLLVMVQADPWYSPQYAIPLLGMLLGNTLNGVTLSLTRLRDGFKSQRAQIENRLMLGESAWQACSVQRREAMTAALIPAINSMAAAGIVSLPGMMTGQILAGTDPQTAASYQILIFLLITAGTGFGTYVATYLAYRQMFDERGRLVHLY